MLVARIIIMLVIGLGLSFAGFATPKDKKLKDPSLSQIDLPAKESFHRIDSAFMWLVFCDKIDEIKKMDSNKIISWLDTDGRSLLYYAKTVEMKILLLTIGVIPKYDLVDLLQWSDAIGNCLLSYATTKELIIKLLNLGMDPNFKNKKGQDAVGACLEIFGNNIDIAFELQETINEWQSEQMSKKQNKTDYENEYELLNLDTRYRFLIKSL